ncbi:protein kinase [Nonomuraea purpurea]|uniref:non-specific serine/threonine protein kinase n=1 Tax=Nonomuraea purpurea TaxID=1849276 RepID=A0ABV8G1J3_9ACTN
MSDRKQDGRRIAGRYQLQEPIGRGGMGIVWRAHDELLDRTVAVKEVRYAAALGEEVQLLNRRTMREARAAARFEHPNVIVVHDVIEEDDRPWIVMQLVQSRSLGTVIKQDGPLPHQRVAEIGLAVLDALHRAHESGVLHRDVKPENVLLADDGRVVLTDFGIATLETETQLTVTGLAGTPAFIAPERLKGLPARRESDLWALGATLYTAVEGRSPHERGMALATMHAVLTDEPDPAHNAGPLAEVINGLLVKEPVQRLTYEEAQRQLRRVIAQESAPPTAQFPAAQPLHVPPATQPRKVSPPPRPRPAPTPPRQAPPRQAPPRQVPVEDDLTTDPNLNLHLNRAPSPLPRAPETGARATPAPQEPDKPQGESTVNAASPEQWRPGPVIAAASAVVLVAGVGAILGLNSAPDTDSPNTDTSQASVVTQPSSGAAQPSSTPSVSPSQGQSAAPSPTAASPSVPPAETEDPLPKGWHWYEDKKLGFAVGLPEKWKVFTRPGSKTVQFRGPGAAPKAYLEIAKADVGSDAVKYLGKRTSSYKYKYGGYEKLDTKKVDGYHKTAADLDFTWRANSGHSHVRVRAVTTENGRGYTLLWHTLQSRWKNDFDFFEGFAETFERRK